MLTFRPATVLDSDAVVALVTSAYRGEASHAGWTTEAHLIEGQRIDADLLGDDLGNPRGRVVVAFDGGALVGCFNLVRLEGRAVYFGLFAVSPTRQGGGLGKQVLGEAERLAREEWGAETIEMTVLELRPELIAFYERRGFVRTGDFAPFPYGDERFGRPLREDLRMVVLRKPL